MKYLNESNRINKLLKIATFKPQTARFTPEPLKEFPGPVSYVGGENLNIYENEMQYLFKSDLSISETYTLETFEQTINGLILSLKKEERESTKDDLKRLFEGLLSAEIREYEVLSEVRGISLSTEKLVLGDFTIYHWIHTRKELVAQYKSLEEYSYFEFIKSRQLTPLAPWHKDLYF